MPIVLGTGDNEVLSTMAMITAPLFGQPRSFLPRSIERGAYTGRDNGDDIAANMTSLGFVRRLIRP